MSDRRPMFVGNWKMNLSFDQSAQLAKDIAVNVGDLENVDVLVAPPFTGLALVKKAIGHSKIFLSGQNMHWETSGAYTGEISGAMLVEAGCSYVILGHSERRSLFKETDEMIDLKVKAALSLDLIPIICIGETLEQREGGKTFEVLRYQLEESLRNLRDKKQLPETTILAYEPVWAIGTGLTATPEQAEEVHHYIRNWIGENFGRGAASLIRILYGGSVKPENIRDLMSRPDIDGALVGGASLTASAFIPIIRFQEKSP